MRYFIGFFALLLLFGGCSKPVSEITMADEHKSCDALTHEYESLNASYRELPEKKLETSDYFHRGVIGGGIIASLNPANLFGNYFYVIPVMTVWYYNHFIESRQHEDAAKSQKMRLDTLERLLHHKRCNEGKD